MARLTDRARNDLNVLKGGKTEIKPNQTSKISMANALFRFKKVVVNSRGIMATTRMLEMKFVLNIEI